MTRKSEDIHDRFHSRIITGFLTSSYTRRPTLANQNATAANLLRDAIEQAASWKRRYLRLASEVQQREVVQ